MNRMHPQDLRAIVAALQCLRSSNPDRDTAIRWTDGLLAELERTAKPEPEQDPCPCCRVITKPGFKRAHAPGCILDPEPDPHHCACGASIHRPKWTHTQECPNYEQDPASRALEAALRENDRQWQEIVEARKALTREAIARAEKAERERIIALMVAWDGNERVYNTRGRFDALALRAALEPKP